LEDLVLKMGYDPSNINAAKELAKKKNVEISALRKQLKLLASEDPTTKEIEETEIQKSNMMKLIMEQNLQIKQMEEKMEKLVREKEETVKMAQIPMDVVPLLAVSITRVYTSGTTATTSTAEGAKQLAEVF